MEALCSGWEKWECGFLQEGASRQCRSVRKEVYLVFWRKSVAKCQLLCDRWVHNWYIRYEKKFQTIPSPDRQLQISFDLAVKEAGTPVFLFWGKCDPLSDSWKVRLLKSTTDIGKAGAGIASAPARYPRVCKIEPFFVYSRNYIFPNSLQ